MTKVPEHLKDEVYRATQEEVTRKSLAREHAEQIRKAAEAAAQNVNNNRGA